MSDLGKLNTKVGAGRATTARQTPEPAPHSDDDFMTRIQLALDMTPRQLADALMLDVGDVVDRVGPRSAMSSSVTDPFWQTLLNFVDNKLAGFMAIKQELERKARLDQREHIERMNKVRNRR